MNTLLYMAMMLCGADNIYHVDKIYVRQVIDEHNLIGVAGILTKVHTCWFNIDTTDIIDGEDIKLDFPYLIKEKGTFRYPTALVASKTVWKFRTPTIEEQMQIMKMQEELKRQQPKIPKKKKRPIKRDKLPGEIIQVN